MPARPVIYQSLLAEEVSGTEYGDNVMLTGLSIAKYFHFSVFDHVEVRCRIIFAKQEISGGEVGIADPLSGIGSQI